MKGTYTTQTMSPFNWLRKLTKFLNANTAMREDVNKTDGPQKRFTFSTLS